MSLSSALTNSLSGLNVASRSAEIVSNNVSNAMTEGYGVRELQISARTLSGAGAGAKIDGVSRIVDQKTIADRRIAQASGAAVTAVSDALIRIENAIGEPSEAGSLSSRIAGFEASLVQAASLPDSSARLDAAVAAAKGTAQQINSISSEIQGVRTAADAEIQSQVDFLNSKLAQVQDLNQKISVLNNSNRDATGLMDQRQVVIDSIADIVPVRTLERDSGKLALYTSGGAVLLEGRPATFEFTATAIVTPGMTIENGALSELTLNGSVVSTANDKGQISGGSLAALFKVRDEIAPEAQAGLDALARDLVERFQDPTLDTSLNAGDPGLFTDGNGAFDVANETGLAGRIAVNALVDPDAGGATWRLRAGLNATGQGEVGDAALLGGLKDALTAPRVATSGAGAGLEFTAAGFAAEYLSGIATDRQINDSEVVFHNTQIEALKSQEALAGVDTDQEMQKLLLIEQAYAANARVIETLDTLMKQILEL